MFVSINWLKKFGDVDADTDELVSVIGSKLAEVESVEHLADKYRGIVVAEISEAGDHPDADKLGLYKVDNGKEKVQVVAGDKTLKVGDKVAYIAPGLIVPSSFNDEEPFRIEKRPLRGQDSNGMLASSAELDWGTDHSGVLKLDTDKPAGTSLEEAYELDDIIIEIENKTLTHRPDCFGLIGFAREVAGIFNKKFESPKTGLLSDIGKSDTDLDLSIVVKSDDCARYVGLAMDNVEIKPSPQIVQAYLARVGVRPINNVVDVTNYIAIETGQPLHAFDYDKIEKLSKNRAAIVVRSPAKDEKLTLLDGKEITLREGSVLISTDENAVALAGAMGGANSEVDENTKAIIIESANFDMYSIRKTSMAHGIFSEAVTRFIRGQDPGQCEQVAVEAARMIAQNSGAKVASDVVDVYPSPSKDKTITISTEFINQRLGSSYSGDDMVKTLQNVELNARFEAEKLTVKVPTYRKDLNIEEDIVEEIGRLNGYDNLDYRLPTRDISAVDVGNLQTTIKDSRDAMARAGCNEVLTFNFQSEKDFTKIGLNPENAFRIRNSISPKLQVMRTSLLPSLIEKIHPNIKLGYSEFGLFEINKSHRKNNMDGDLPNEDFSIAYVFAANDKARTEVDFGAAYYQAKYILDYLLDQLSVAWTEVVGLSEVDDDWVGERAKTFDPNRAAVVVSENGPLGIVGEFTDKVRKSHKLPNYVCGFEVNLLELIKLRRSDSTYQPQSRFPATQQDVTFELPSEVKSRDVLEAIAEQIVNTEDMQNIVSLSDIYQKDDDRKSLTYSLELRHDSHTLTSEEANKIVAETTSVIEDRFNAKLA